MHCPRRREDIWFFGMKNMKIQATEWASEQRFELGKMRQFISSFGLACTPCILSAYGKKAPTNKWHNAHSPLCSSVCLLFQCRSLRRILPTKSSAHCLCGCGAAVAQSCAKIRLFVYKRRFCFLSTYWLHQRFEKRKIRGSTPSSPAIVA